MFRSGSVPIAFFGVLYLLFFSTYAHAQQEVCVSWDPPTQNSDGSALLDLDGYILSYGMASGEYSTHLDVRATPQGCMELNPGTYFFVARAYDRSGNVSVFSEEIQHTVLPENGDPNGGGDGDNLIPGDETPGDDADRPNISNGVDFDGDGVLDPVFIKRSGRKKIGLFHVRVETGVKTLLPVTLTRGAQTAAIVHQDGLPALQTVGAKGKRLRWTSMRISDGAISKENFGKVGQLVLPGCDLDGDGTSDLIRANKRAVFAKLSSSGGSQKVATGLRKIKALSCGALSGDSAHDLVVLGKAKGKESTELGLQKGEHLLKIISLTGEVETLISPKAKQLVVGDFDGDGQRSLAVRLRNGGEFFVIELEKATVEALAIPESYSIAPIETTGGRDAQDSSELWIHTMADTLVRITPDERNPEQLLDLTTLGVPVRKLELVSGRKSHRVK